MVSMSDVLLYLVVVVVGLAVGVPLSYWLLLRLGWNEDE